MKYTSLLTPVALAVLLAACGGDQQATETQQKPADTSTATATATANIDAATTSKEAPAEVVNPAALVKLGEFRGEEAEGFHDCFWIGPVSYLSYNAAYPDEGAVYWMGSFQLPEGASHLEISGNYPQARYMSFNAYNKAHQPTDALIDREIAAFEGANPYSSADKSGGKYRIKVISEAAPTSDRPENTLYLGDAATRNDVLPLIMRVYIPENGTDFTGNAGIPDVSMVMKNGETLSGEAMCQAINSPKPVAGGRPLPSVTMDADVYNSLVNAPGVPEGFPARQPVEWTAFWGGQYDLGKLAPDRIITDKAIADSAAGTLPKQSGYYANTHNDYIAALINEDFGEVVVLKGTLPRTPNNGWDITSGEYDMRYWSICTNENIVTTRYAACVRDSNVITDEERQYTVVVSKAANRPANATADCGVTWLDWGEHGDGAGNTEQGHLIIRNMDADHFQYSMQNIKSMGSAEQDLGSYFPKTHYSSKAEFEALGCN